MNCDTTAADQQSHSRHQTLSKKDQSASLHTIRTDQTGESNKGATPSLQAAHQVSFRDRLALCIIDVS